MPRVMLVVVAALLTIYCVVEVAQADADRVRKMPRWLWVAVIILVPLVGPVCWLIFGRPTRPDEGGKRRRRPQAPDDDPEFLRGL